MAVIIPVNDHYRINLDQYSWQVSKWKRLNKHPEDGKWEGVTWHKTLQQAGECLVQRFVAQEDLEGVQEIIEALHASSQLVARSIRESAYHDSWLDEKKTDSCTGC